MDHVINYQDAKKIMKSNVIGPDDLDSLSLLSFSLPENTDVPFSLEYLKEKKDDYLLIYGVDKFIDGTPVTIRNMINIFGKNPDVQEPCFYNQDWYDKESFIDAPMSNGWYFIRKKVYEDSRAVQPNELKNKYVFPSAISCVYSFFVVWLTKNIKLWYHDFVWCEDFDHNGDRIYVGKYNDVDGINKNGFSIHRHLGLRDCYACID